MLSDSFTVNFCGEQIELREITFKELVRTTELMEPNISSTRPMEALFSKKIGALKYGIYRQLNLNQHGFEHSTNLCTCQVEHKLTLALV